MSYKFEKEECPKCNSKLCLDTPTVYTMEEQGYAENLVVANLKYNFSMEITCSRCGYTWDETPMDKRDETPIKKDNQETK